MKKQTKIGFYICHCGTNIASKVDVEAVTEHAKKIPGVVVAKNYQYMCSDPGQDMIKKDIKELCLERIVIATCSPRMHELTFRKAVNQAGLNPYLLEIVNVREQCSWVHEDKTKATEKAKELVTASIARAKLLQPLKGETMSVTPSALIIGGGIAGIEAALDIAESGFKTYLVEKNDNLGGNVAKLNKTFTNLNDYGIILKQRIEDLKSNKNVELYLNSEIESVEGSLGNFKILIKKSGEEHKISTGTIIIATGYDIFDAKKKPELGYGKYENVITNMELEEMLSKDDLKINEKIPKKIFFLQCVGSRDHSVGNEYCSRVCCITSAKQAMQLKEKIPEADISINYIDVRAFGKGFEEFYEKAQKKGIIYRRGLISEVNRKKDRLVIKAEDTLSGEICEEEADLLVLANGMTPRKDSDKLKDLLKLQKSSDGFYAEAHPKLKPLDTSLDGIYLAGCCQGPKDIADSVSQAHGAASRALTYLFKGQVKTDPVVSEVDKTMCAGCDLCSKACEYGALKINDYEKKMRVNTALCKGCGACNAACPSNAISLKHYTTEQVMSQVKELSSPEKE